MPSLPLLVGTGCLVSELQRSLYTLQSRLSADLPLQHVSEGSYANVTLTLHLRASVNPGMVFSVVFKNDRYPVL